MTSSTGLYSVKASFRLGYELVMELVRESALELANKLLVRVNHDQHDDNHMIGASLVVYGCCR